MTNPIWIALYQEQQEVLVPPATTRYRVLFRATSGGISPHLFMLRVSDDGFSHVATPAELTRYPTTKAEALDAGIDFYRVQTFTLDLDARTTAATFCADVRERVEFTRAAWEEGEAVDFGGNRVFVYPT